MIPLRVIEEIDAKKYSRRIDLAKRARKLLPALERLLGPGGTPGWIGESVNIELPSDPGHRYRPEDGDEEVLETCRELQQVTGQPVRLVTGDVASRLRAQASGVGAIELPALHQRTPDTEA